MTIDNVLFLIVFDGISDLKWEYKKITEGKKFVTELERPPSRHTECFKLHVIFLMYTI